MCALFGPDGPSCFPKFRIAFIIGPILVIYIYIYHLDEGLLPWFQEPTKNSYSYRLCIVVELICILPTILFFQFPIENAGYIYI